MKSLVTVYACGRCGVTCVRLPTDPAYAQAGYCSAAHWQCRLCNGNQHVPGWQARTYTEGCDAFGRRPVWDLYDEHDPAANYASVVCPRCQGGGHEPAQPSGVRYALTPVTDPPPAPLRIAPLLPEAGEDGGPPASERPVR